MATNNSRPVSRTSRKARDDDAATFEIPSLEARLAVAGQTLNPLTRGAPTLAAEPPLSAPVSMKVQRPTTVGVHEGETIYLVPLDQIDTNPYNARHIYREERVKEMAISLASDGQFLPAIATLRNDRYVLAAGHYRFRGARLAGIPHLKIILRPEMSDRELYELSYKENAEREGESALDNAISWSKALNDKLYQTMRELADAMGVPAPTVTKTLTLLNLPESTLDEVREEPTAFGFSVLYELLQYSQYADREQTLKMAKQIRAGEVSRRDIEQARKALEHPKVRKTREGARKYSIVSNDIQIGSLKDWDSGKVLLEVKIDDPSKRVELVAELCKRFGIVHGDS